ncbi:MAG: relaxase/mobilization nuclease domain-containing protein [Selenomonadaceae bacterium]
MAVTSIWDIKGRVDKVINYVANPEKTINVNFGEIASLHAIDGIVEYTTDDMKTEKQFYVDGINCDPEFAAEQFMDTKRHYNKTGGIVCFHGYQSFRKNEVTAEIAHKVGLELAQHLWGDRFEVIVATHLNTGHYHNHFLLNSVSFKDGYRYYDQKKTYYEMRRVSDELCHKYRLSVIENPGHGGKNYGEWLAEKQGRPTVRGRIREQIYLAISQSTTTKHFWNAMEVMGYELNMTGKYPAVKPPGAPYFYRLYKLGDNYTAEAIKKRILKNISRQHPFIEPEKSVKSYHFNGNFKTAIKLTGLRALYLHYCYKLNIIQKHPTSNRRVHFLLYQDLIKFDRIIAECSFLEKTKLNTIEELNGYKNSTEIKISGLTQKRKCLKNQLKRLVRSNDISGQETVKIQISEVSTELKMHRDELKLCDGISARSVQMKENLKQAGLDEIKQREEKKNYEHIRRSGRPSR